MAPRTIQSWNSPGQNIGVGSLSFLQGIFPTQGLNPGLQHCGWILHQLSHKESPKILEWIAYPFRGFPDPGIEPGSPALQADSLPTELSGKPYVINLLISSRANSSSMILIIVLAFLCPLLVHMNFKTILQVLPTKTLSEILLKLCCISRLIGKELIYDIEFSHS